MSGVLDGTSPLTDCVIGDEPDADGEQDTAERIVGEQGEQAGAEEEEQVSVVVLPKYHPVATPDEAHAMLANELMRTQASGATIREDSTEASYAASDAVYRSLDGGGAWEATLRAH